MMADRVSSEDSDAPEEFTLNQGLEQDTETRKLERENRSRIARECKERRRRWAQKKTPRTSKGTEMNKDVEESKQRNEVTDELPNDIVNLLAAREKQLFLSDSEEEITEKKSKLRKKKLKTSGPEPVILNEIPPAQCLQNSLDFLKKRKMQVPRSSSVLNNANQALRLISTKGLLK